MEQNPEGGAPQNPAPEATVTISQKELDELKHKAEVSGQNFSRLKKVEEEMINLKAQLQVDPITEEPSNEELVAVKSQLSSLEMRLQKSDVLEAYPTLKDAWSDFESYTALPENAGMPLKTAAKAFVVEKGLLEPQRKGLETPTGGNHTPPSTGMTPDEIANLRKNDGRKYMEMVRKGLIVIKE